MVVTNALGVAFTATLLSVSDTGATFVFPEDGATNVLAWSRLSPASCMAVCATADFVPVTPQLASTVRMARDEQARIADLEADGRIDKKTAAEMRQRLSQTFRKACRKRGLDDARADSLFLRVTRRR